MLIEKLRDFIKELCGNDVHKTLSEENDDKSDVQNDDNNDQECEDDVIILQGELPWSEDWSEGDKKYGE